MLADNQTTKDVAKSVNKIDVFSQSKAVFLIKCSLLFFHKIQHKIRLHLKCIDQQPNEADQVVMLYCFTETPDDMTTERWTLAFYNGTPLHNGFKNQNQLTALTITATSILDKRQNQTQVCMCKHRIERNCTCGIITTTTTRIQLI